MTLGESIPAGTAHAVSVSLPTWADNVGYEEGEARVVNAMQTGYPRFFVHKSIQKLSNIILEQLAKSSEACYLFPTPIVAQSAIDFLKTRDPPVLRCSFQSWCPDTSAPDTATIYPVFLPADDIKIGKQFWQHTGDGISSRLADHCLSLLQSNTPPSPSTPKLGSRNKHYSKPSQTLINTLANSTPEVSDIDTYVEERYGRNLSAANASMCKVALRRRIAGVLSESSTAPSSAAASPTIPDENARGVHGLSENDVFLYPAGMSAIFHSHQLALQWQVSQGKRPGKSVCFGFPYTDTLKILQKWGPGVHFFGKGVDSDLPELEKLCQQEPILAVFCEFPSNPLLRSPNLTKLRQLADQYGFLLIVDETVGNFVNINVIEMADIVNSSLTKIFSGDCNVMGGSMILNPQSGHYDTLKGIQNDMYEDTYFYQDAIFMERNSRNFISRISKINKTTEAVCAFLHEQIGRSVIKQVYYPKYITAENYRSRMRTSALATSTTETEDAEPGFGGLFSVTFTSPIASAAFFDNMAIDKGPSLGTNFSLGCPYTILAHYFELDWAASFGVEAGLVRVSVGLEETDDLLGRFKTALEKAEEAVRNA